MNRKVLIILVLLLSGLLLVVLPTSVRRCSTGQTISVNGYDIVHVDLSPARRARDVQGESREWKDAYVVRLKVTNPFSPTLRIDYFIGDYRVPE